MTNTEVCFKTHASQFEKILGSNAEILLLHEDTSTPWAHEAGVYIKETDELFVTSNRIFEQDGSQNINISKISLAQKPVTVERVSTDIVMANGGVNYKDGIVFCFQGNLEKPSGLAYMEVKPPYRTTTIIKSFHGRRFTSPNDVVVHDDGSIWFTDPIYGHEQGFRPKPELPNQVYRYDPINDNIRAVADGFGRPNGLCFAPDEQTLYVTDTDYIHGDGTTDATRASSIYAFDIITRHGQPFLANRHLFAMADGLLPDGIKCDTDGNVFSGCCDGINVWSPGGVLLGKILIPGGVANFCFGKRGTIYALNETRLWQINLASDCTGALLRL